LQKTTKENYVMLANLTNSCFVAHIVARQVAQDTGSTRHNINVIRRQKLKIQLFLSNNE